MGREEYKCIEARKIAAEEKHFGAASRKGMSGMTSGVVLPELLAETIAIRRDLHAHPELSFEEERTAAIVAKSLRGLELTVYEGIGKTGVVGVLSGSLPGPTTMLRADMDALPMQDAGEAPYRSRADGISHACGHDAHVARLLGAAKVLAARAGEVRGRIAFVFQPGEEAGGGAEAMLDDGLIERFSIDRVYGLHVVTTLLGVQGSPSAFRSGSFALRSGPLMAGADSFDLVIEGRGGHGAAPHLCVDPVLVAAEVVTALQRVISREIDPVETAVLTIGAINGGSTYNVIPPRVSLKGAIRWFSDRTRESIVQRVEQIAKHVCEAGRATCSISWLPPCPATVNDKAEATFVAETLKKTFGEQRVVESPLVMASEDFSCFLRVVPGCFYFLGAGNATHSYPNHHPAFDIDENAMAAGIEAHVAIALAAASLP
jgi:amidohydrolase